MSTWLKCKYVALAKAKLDKYEKVNKTDKTKFIDYLSTRINNN